MYLGVRTPLLNNIGQPWCKVNINLNIYYVACVFRVRQGDFFNTRYFLSRFLYFSLPTHKTFGKYIAFEMFVENYKIIYL